jgi:alcohol dehydrogenase
VRLQDRTLDLVPSGRILFGRGQIAGIGSLVRGLGAQRVLVITDPGVVDAGVAARVIEPLAAAGLSVEVLDRIAANPSTDDVVAGSAVLRGLLDVPAGGRGAAEAGGGAVVVAVGGGSPIDAAKAIALHASNDLGVAALLAGTVAARPGVPLIAVPTTAGTGAETNAFGVITDLTTGRKGYLGDESVRPRVAVLDPLLTVGLPPGVTAATGIDALTHALESLMSVNANPYAEGLALGVVRTIARWLPVAVADGADLEGRSQLLLAAHLAGLAMGSGTGLGLAHAVGHPLGARLGAAHGVALAAVLPAVLRYNLPTSTRVLALAASSLDVATGGGALADAEAAITAITALLRGVMGVPTLGALGVTPELVPLLAQDSLDDPVLVNTPRPPTRQDVETLLLTGI